MKFQLKKDQIYDNIKNNIKSGKYSEGQKLPRFTILCDEFGVSMRTIRVAMEALEKDGYIERVHGRGTFVRAKRTSKKYMILLMQERPLENPENYILIGIETEAALHGIQLERVYLEFLDHIPIKDAVEKIRNAGFDGIMTAFHSFELQSNIYKILHDSGLPVVLLRAAKDDWKNTGFAAIRFERAQAYADALQEIYAKGHRRICYLGYEKIETGFSFEQMVEMSGIPKNTVRQCVVKFDAANIYAKLAEIIKTWKPTAILCFSDFFALKVYHALAELGIKIPNEISVMGAADFPGGKFLTPALSTIDYNFFASGANGVKILNKAEKWFNSKDTSPPEIFLENQLIWRQSVSKRIEADIV